MVLCARKYLKRLNLDSSKARISRLPPLVIGIGFNAKPGIPGFRYGTGPAKALLLSLLFLSFVYQFKTQSFNISHFRVKCRKV